MSLLGLAWIRRATHELERCCVDSLASAWPRSKRHGWTAGCFATSTADKPDQKSREFYGAYTPVTKALWRQRLRNIGTASPDEPLPDVFVKLPQAVDVTYPFTTNPEILEMYRNPWDRMRIGRVLEDLDSLAGNIAFTHCDDGIAATPPPLLVTAAVERIELRKPLLLSHDAVLGGQVVYSGSSSLDIRLTMHQGGSTEPNLEALFTFVARDPATGKATRVNPVQPQTAEEKSWFDERATAARKRKVARKAAAVSIATAATEPTACKKWTEGLLKEAEVMRVMPGLAARDAVLMDSTKLRNTFTCQPQQRNMHGRIFGGFLMRRAYELAFATVHMFAGTRPRFLAVDRVEFRRPVDVGDLVTFESRVLHTRNRRRDGSGGGCGADVFVEVLALVNRPELASTMPTNRFTLQFTIDSECEAATTLMRVLPASPRQAELMEELFVCDDAPP